MSKVYLVEIPDDGNLVETGNCIVFDAPKQKRTLKRMRGGMLYNQDKVDSMVNSAIALGHAEAWELAQKIANPQAAGGFTVEEMDSIFGTRYVAPILRNNTYDEAAQKVHAWEEQMISDNDVIVNDITGKESLVLSIHDGQAHLLYSDGSSGPITLEFIKRHYKKTGEKLCVLAFIRKHGKGETVDGGVSN